MHYMLLWTAIERYCVFKYDVSKNQGDYLDSFAEDPLFEEAFSKANFGKRDSVYSVLTTSPFYFDIDRNNFIVNHYFTIRCNVAHRGKDDNNDFTTLITSLYELLDIFDEIIDNSFEK